MARTAAFSLSLGLLFVWSWARIEDPRSSIWPVLLMVLLGTAPALLPNSRWRLGAAGVALLVAGAIALDVWRPWSIGRIAGRAGRGFLDFYDVRTPFDPRVQPDMRGVILTAVFCFVLAVSCAIAARRPVVASALLLVGVGWPATLRGGQGALVVGALLLLCVLVVLAEVRGPERGEEGESWLRPGGVAVDGATDHLGFAALLDPRGLDHLADLLVGRDRFELDVRVIGVGALDLDLPRREVEVQSNVTGCVERLASHR